MRPAMLRAIVSLVQAGWRQYNHEPTKKAYEKLRCPYGGKKSGKRPFWFVRGDIFCCLSCSRGCALSRPEGFWLPLPIQYPENASAPFALTPQEMVSRKALLRVDEAAYCLNISERTVYDWITEGKLRKAREQPIRVSAEDVAFRMTNFDD